MKCTPDQIFKQIDAAMQVQKEINEISQKFNLGNKTTQLIRQIFTRIFKNYIQCYSIVCIGIFAVFQKIDDLNKQKLHYLQKLIIFFNQDYTKKFMMFIENNKSIDVFKDFRYTELLTINEGYFSILRQFLCAQEQQNLNIHTICKINLHDQQNQLIINFQQQQSEKEQKIIYKHKKKIQITDHAKIQQIKSYFQQYKNFYHDEFSVTQEVIPLKNPSFLLRKKQSIFDNIANKPLNQNLEIKAYKFNNEQWNQWGNVYAF